MANPDSSLTPEQRLLKIIESPEEAAKQAQRETAGRGGVKAASKKKEGAPVNWSSLLSPSAIKGRLVFAKDLLFGGGKVGTETLNVKQLNNVVKIFAVGFAGYVVVASSFETLGVYKDYSSKFKVSQKEMAEVPISEGYQVDPALFDEVDKRNIFIPQEKRVQAEANPDAQEASLRLVEITKDLKLAGISMNEQDPTRTFCMVEDLKKNVTNFLKVGDTISGLKVDQINEDGVVLKHQKEQIELR